MRRLILLALVMMAGTIGKPARADNFKDQQLQFPKVRQAYSKKEADIKKLFAEKKIPYPPAKIFLRVFKQEMEVEVWAWKEKRFALLTTTPICYIPDRMGPKRQQGDLHTPEGFYAIEHFNPASEYHLSLKINYPNASDKIQGSAKLGGDIFIHGGCGSRGCVSLTDGKMEELYLIAVEAKAQGQGKIPIHIFPARLDKKGMKSLASKHPRQKPLLEFWKSLQQGFQRFEETRMLFKVFVTADGGYQIGPSS